MEPRVFTRGNMKDAHPVDVIRIASMEPRVFTRGNSNSTIFIKPPHRRFNGATRLHAWKRVKIRYIRRLCRGLQWSHASSRVETPARMNADARHQSASMEPRVFTRG